MRPPWLAVLPLLCPDMSLFLEANNMTGSIGTTKSIGKRYNHYDPTTAPGKRCLRNTPPGTSSWTLPIMPKGQGASVAICLSRFKDVSRKLVGSKNLSLF